MVPLVGDNKYDNHCFVVLQRGWTALMLAGGSGHTHVVQLLLSSGAQVDLQDEVRHNSGTRVKGRL